jgi:hypothetical protein
MGDLVGGVPAQCAVPVPSPTMTVPERALVPAFLARTRVPELIVAVEMLFAAEPERVVVPVPSRLRVVMAAPAAKVMSPLPVMLAVARLLIVPLAIKLPAPASVSPWAPPARVPVRVRLPSSKPRVVAVEIEGGGEGIGAAEVRRAPCPPTPVPITLTAPSVRVMPVAWSKARVEPAVTMLPKLEGPRARGGGQHQRGVAGHGVGALPGVGPGEDEGAAPLMVVSV